MYDSSKMRGKKEAEKKMLKKMTKNFLNQIKKKNRTSSKLNKTPVK